MEFHPKMCMVAKGKLPNPYRTRTYERKLSLVSLLTCRSRYICRYSIQVMKVMYFSIVMANDSLLQLPKSPKEK